LNSCEWYVNEEWNVPVWDDGSVCVYWDPDSKEWTDPEEFRYNRLIKNEVKKGTLQKLFTEGPIARLLKEEDDSVAHESGASGGSLDAQVDRYLSQYESAAKVAEGDDMGASVDQMESLDWRDLVKGRLITEAGEDDEPVEDPVPAPGMDDDEGKLGLDTLDVESFANDVVRLVENYDSLLEVRSTLIRRARKFLEKNYNDDVVQAFEDTLRDDHGLEAGASLGDVEAQKFVAPPAERAAGSAEPGPGGAGGGAP